MIDDALKKFKKAEFEKFESEVSLARLIPFLFVTESIGEVVISRLTTFKTFLAKK